MSPVVRIPLILCILVAGVDFTMADDWPQWLGPNRDSVWRESDIIERFSDQGPKVKWRMPLSGGYSGPAVVGDRVFLMDYVTQGDQTPDPDRRNVLQGTERVLCLHADTGEILWTHEYSCPYEISYPAGPRCTPTVDDGLVYALGAEGNLHCLQADSGDVVWSRDFNDDFHAETPQWGFCGHPLIAGDRLYCITGGTSGIVTAMNKKTGEVIWQALNTPHIGYSAPALLPFGSTEQLIIWHGESLNSLNPATGEQFWSHPLDPNYHMAIVTPRRIGNLIFVGGIINKSLMVEVFPDRAESQVKWYGDKEIGIDPTHSTPIAHDGYLYGVTRQGAICCVKPESGKRVWSTFAQMPDNRREHSGTVFIVRNNQLYYLFNDSGQLSIASMTPRGYQEKGRVQILETTGIGMNRSVVWSHPAYARQCMYARNDKEIVCVSLAR